MFTCDISILTFLIIGILWVRRALGTIQPLDMPQPSPNIPLLQLRPRHLLLLLRLELHVAIILCATIHRTRGRAAYGAADVTASRPRVLKPVQIDGQVTLVRHPAVGHVPLLRAESTDKLFVVADHHDAALV